MSGLQMRLPRLQMRLERLLGLRGLWWLLPLLGTLRLVVDASHTALHWKETGHQTLVACFSHPIPAYLKRSQTPRSDQSWGGLAHQSIDTVSACTECHDKEHAAHHREVSKEGRSVGARCRGVTYGPVGMENQRKRKRVEEKGESYPSGIKSGHQHQTTAQFEGYGAPDQNIWIGDAVVSHCGHCSRDGPELVYAGAYED